MTVILLFRLMKLVFYLEDRRNDAEAHHKMASITSDYNDVNMSLSKLNVERQCDQHTTIGFELIARRTQKVIIQELGNIC